MTRIESHRLFGVIGAARVRGVIVTDLQNLESGSSESSEQGRVSASRDQVTVFSMTWGPGSGQRQGRRGLEEYLTFQSPPAPVVTTLPLAIRQQAHFAVVRLTG